MDTKRKQRHNTNQCTTKPPPSLTQVLCLSLLCLFFGPDIKAELTLNFQKDNENSYFSTCAARYGGVDCYLGTSGEAEPFSPFNEQSRFLSNNTGYYPEIVTDPNTGLEYWHMVIGEVKAGEDGFAMEVYIEKGGTGNNFRSISCGGFGGGHSASGGELCASVKTISTFEGNGSDPLETNMDGRNIDSGNGSANPNKVIMRQLIVQGDLTMEFVKNQFSQKPLITQVIDDTEINMNFSLNMGNSTYNDQSTAAIIVNTLDLKTGDSIGDFDMADDAEKSNVTAGRYIYTGGIGLGQYGGNYTYVEGGGDPYSVAWEDYFDANSPDNIWSFDGNMPD